MTAPRTIVITGASDGIGAAAARTLAKAGEQVVVVGRSAGKTRALAGDIGADYYLADFAQLSQVRDLAAKIKEKYPRIDVLANNAGGIMGKRTLTVDGNESTFQVNHLAPFLLTTLLMDTLTASNAKVINTSSAANNFGKLDLFDLNAEYGYSTNRAYGTGKLANILFTSELHRRFHDQGITTRGPHQLRSGVREPVAARLHHLAEPLHAQPGPGCRHHALAHQRHRRNGLDLRRLLRQARPGQGLLPGLRRRTGARPVGEERRLGQSLRLSRCGPTARSPRHRGPRPGRRCHGQ